MTYRSTVARGAAIPRPDLYAICRMKIDGKPFDLRLGWEEIERDARWAAEMLAAHGVGPGKNVLIISGAHENPWIEPLYRAVRRLGAVLSCAEIWGFDAGRTEMLCRRLNLHMVIGLNVDVTKGLANFGGPKKVFAKVPTVLAHPPAHALLRDDGMKPGVLGIVGPATAIQCTAGAGAHVNGREWNFTDSGGKLSVTNIGHRMHKFNSVALGIEGSVHTGNCACGRSDPLLKLGGI